MGLDYPSTQVLTVRDKGRTVMAGDWWSRGQCGPCRSTNPFATRRRLASNTAVPPPPPPKQAGKGYVMRQRPQGTAACRFPRLGPGGFDDVVLAQIAPGPTLQPLS